VGDDDSIHAEWCGLYDEIARDVWTMNMRAEVIGDLDDELVRMQRDGSGMFLDNVLRPMYAEAQAISVRRLVDNRAGTRSLVRLVAEMAKHPTILSRERYVARYVRPDDPNFLQLGHGDFDKMAGAGAAHVSKSTLTELRSRIVTDGEVVKAYVDQNVAHRKQARGRRHHVGRSREGDR